MPRSGEKNLILFLFDFFPPHPENELFMVSKDKGNNCLVSKESRVLFKLLKNLIVKDMVLV